MSCPIELVKVMHRWTLTKPGPGREWMQHVYAASNGYSTMYQVTDGARMLRAKFDDPIDRGYSRVAPDGTFSPAEWPPAFSDFDSILRHVSPKPEGPWGFDPALFDFKEISHALIKADLRISREKRPKDRQTLAMRYRVKLALGGPLDPMHVTCGPVEILVMSCRL